MPIVDYKKNADLAEAHFFADSGISERNKRHVKRFLATYDVSPARKAIFLKHIVLLLCRAKDIKTDLNNRDKINRIFKGLRDKLSVAYYSTVVNVSLRFVRWLSDGTKPLGFKDIQNVAKAKQRRNLTAQDMVSWDDGLKLIDATNDIMVKAIAATQLDGGFRPSEFVDLNFGDVEQKKDFVVAHVNGGKTGARSVVLWRAAPYILRWLQCHPTKKKSDPLWVKEGTLGSRYERYDYRAMQARIRHLAERVKLEKPVDFYSLRHSACTLSKLDNVPEEIAAAKFGHTIEYYTSTYGRLTAEDILQRFSKHYGIEREQKKVERNTRCARCDFVNVPDAAVCEKCCSALSLGDALAVEKERQTLSQEVGDLKEQLGKINRFMNTLVSQNPDVLDVLARRAKRTGLRKVEL